MSEYRKDDHDRVLTSGAWFGAFVVTLGMVWVSTKVPYAVAWLLNSAVTLGVSYAMARWKRAWYAWLAFWGLAAVCVVNGILKAATPLLDSPWSSANLVIAWVLVGSWYWLVRIPRKHPLAGPQVQHIVHHHVVHGPDGGFVPGYPSVTGWTGQEALPEHVLREVPGSAPKAIESYAVSPGAFIGRRGELAARLKQHIRRN